MLKRPPHHTFCDVAVSFVSFISLPRCTVLFYYNYMYRALAYPKLSCGVSHRGTIFDDIQGESNRPVLRQTLHSGPSPLADFLVSSYAPRQRKMTETCCSKGIAGFFEPPCGKFFPYSAHIAAFQIKEPFVLFRLEGGYLRRIAAPWTIANISQKGVEHMTGTGKLLSNSFIASAGGCGRFHPETEAASPPWGRR